MALKWVIGNFSTGEVTHDLPGVVRDAGVVRNIFGDDTADIQIVWDQLTNSQKNNWKTFFAPGERFVALIDTERTWSHRHAVLFAGYIAKCESPIGKGTFKIRATGLREYMASRYVLPYEDKVTNPEAKVTFGAENIAGLLSRIAKRCFNQTSYPSGTPKPPNVVGDFPDSSVGTAVEWEHTWADMKTYDALLEEICADKRREIWFTPRWENSSTERIVWDMDVVNPQNLGSPETHWLDSRTKLSSAGTYLDSSDIFSRIWASAEDKTDDKKIILKPFAASSGSMSVLFERLENFEVPLTESDLNSRAQEYLTLEGNRIPQTFTATYEEVGVRGSMADYLGTLIRYRGIDGTISAGIDATMRVVAVEFSPRKESVTLTVQEPQVYYKRLPRPGRIGKDNKKGGGRGPGGKDGGSGFVPTPPNPWEPGGRPPESTVIGQWGFGSGPVDEYPLLHNTPVKFQTVRTGAMPWASSATLIQESNIVFAIPGSNQSVSFSYAFTEAGTTLPVLETPTTNMGFYGCYLTNNGEFIDAKLVYDAPVITPELTFSISNFLTPLLVGGFGRLIREVHYEAALNAAQVVGGKIIIPFTVGVRWHTPNSNGTNWESGVSSFFEWKTVFIEAPIGGYDVVQQFFTLIPNLWTELDWNMEYSGGAGVTGSVNIRMQRLGEAQVIIGAAPRAANNNAIVIDLREVIGGVNDPSQQWRIPNLPIHPTDGQLHILNIGYGMLETTEGLQSALYVTARGASSSSNFVLLAHPTYADSMIPNTEDYGWVVRFDEGTVGSIPTPAPGIPSNRAGMYNFSKSTTWYGRAVMLGGVYRVAYGSYQTQIGLIWNGTNTGRTSISSILEPFPAISGQNYMTNPAYSYVVWNSYLFRSDGNAYLVEWDV